MTGARILVVEDTPDSLDLVTYLLEASGHTVIAAPTGELGVELAVAHRPDLVLLDIHLPDIDGYEVLSQLRANPDLARLVVVAVTADVMFADRESALSSGFDGFLSKPIDPASFAAKVDGYLPASLRGRSPSPRW